jgi:hypothetical protein
MPGHQGGQTGGGQLALQSHPIASSLAADGNQAPDGVKRGLASPPALESREAAVEGNVGPGTGQGRIIVEKSDQPGPVLPQQFSENFGLSPGPPEYDRVDHRKFYARGAIPIALEELSSDTGLLIYEGPRPGKVAARATVSGWRVGADFAEGLL